MGGNLSVMACLPKHWTGMGFFKDLRQLHDTGAEMQKASGRRSGFAGLKDAVAESNQMLQGLQQGSADAQRLMMTGTVATGIIKAVRDTGTLVNNSPMVEFDLDVTVPGQPPYPVTHRQIVNQLQIPSIQPGNPVPLRVDPMDANTVLILGV
jgi:hypothetical protein